MIARQSSVPSHGMRGWSHWIQVSWSWNVAGECTKSGPEWRTTTRLGSATADPSTGKATSSFTAWPWAATAPGSWDSRTHTIQPGNRSSSSQVGSL